MRFYGFQKMTLLDFPGKVACIVFTGGCNLRCPFCHNASLVTHIHPEQSIDEEEILAYLAKRRRMLEGVCVTGGEPLMQRELVSFLRRVKELGLSVKLDTNGTLPDRLREVVEAGLVDYVAVDVKNDREHYAATVGIEGFDVTPVEQTLHLLSTGVVPYELRTTVVDELHDVKCIEQIAKALPQDARYFLQSFTDSGDLITDTPLHAPSQKTLENMLQAAQKHVPATKLRG